jgi:hypothetical protein
VTITCCMTWLKEYELQNSKALAIINLYILFMNIQIGMSFQNLKGYLSWNGFLRPENSPACCHKFLFCPQLMFSEFLVLQTFSFKLQKSKQIPVFC